MGAPVDFPACISGVRAFVSAAIARLPSPSPLRTDKYQPLSPVCTYTYRTQHDCLLVGQPATVGCVSPVEHPKSTHPECWSQAWDTRQQRLDLWGAAQPRPPGPPASCPRSSTSDAAELVDVGRVLLSAVFDLLPPAPDAPAALPLVCSGLLADVLTEAHALGIEVYALFAASNEAFSEIGLAARAARWNSECSTGSADRFDGVVRPKNYHRKCYPVVLVLSAHTHVLLSPPSLPSMLSPDRFDCHQRGGGTVRGSRATYT